jgi:hypothetical protein
MLSFGKGHTWGVFIDLNPEFRTSVQVGTMGSLQPCGLMGFRLKGFSGLMGFRLKGFSGLMGFGLKGFSGLMGKHHGVLG